MSRVGRVTSTILLVAGSAETFLLIAWQKLEAVGRGDAILKVAEKLPDWVHHPIAAIIAMIGGYGLLYYLTKSQRTIPKDLDPLPQKRLIIITDDESNLQPTSDPPAPPASAIRLAGWRLLGGLAVAVVIVGITWLLSSPQFQVTVEKGQSLTAKDPRNATKDRANVKTLRIALSEIEPTADGQELLVTGTMYYNGESDLQIRQAGKGSVFQFPKENGYRIEIRKVTEGNAVFLISKNP